MTSHATFINVIDGLDTTVLIAWAGAVFAGLSAAGAIGAVAAQYRLLPRPLWVDLSEPRRQEDGTITWSVRIANSGNAAAHDVRFVWRNNNTGAEETRRIATVLPLGDDFELNIHKLSDTSYENLARTGAWSVMVRWRQAPGLRRVRSKKFIMGGRIVEPGRDVSRAFTLLMRMSRSANRLRGRRARNGHRRLR